MPTRVARAPPIRMSRSLPEGTSTERTRSAGEASQGEHPVQTHAGPVCYSKIKNTQFGPVFTVNKKTQFLL